VVYCPGAKLFFFANDLPYNRIVITFARKFGNAVQRNRARRLGREAYRLMRDNCKAGYDLVLLLYPPVKESAPSKTPPKGEKPKTVKAAARAGSLAESSEQLQTLFKKASLWLRQ
jgi:RNase P protein component